MLGLIDPDDLPPLPFHELEPGTVPDGIVLCCFGLDGLRWDLLGRVAFVMDPDEGLVLLRDLATLPNPVPVAAQSGYRIQALAAYDGDDGQPIRIPDDVQEGLVEIVQHELNRLVQSIAQQN